MTDLELVKNVDPETALARYNACRSCQHFSTATAVVQTIIDAVSGETQQVVIQTRDTCSKYNLTLEGYIGMTHSTCPEDLWK